jgi:hypothetical protein
MTPRHAQNVLGFLQRAQPYLMMNGQEAMVYAETVQMLQAIAQHGQGDQPPDSGDNTAETN